MIVVLYDQQMHMPLRPEYRHGPTGRLRVRGCESVTANAAVLGRARNVHACVGLLHSAQLAIQYMDFDCWHCYDMTGETTNFGPGIDYYANSTQFHTVLHANIHIRPVLDP